MMAKKKREAAGGMNNIKRRVVILIAVAAMAVCSLVVVRGVLLANAQRMGNEIAHSYSAENTRNLIGYETMLRLCTGYIDQQLKSSSDPETWIRIFMQSLVDIVGEDEIDPYAVIDGKIVAADPWEGDGDYDVENTSWYTEAVEADGEVIFTDAYEDAVSGELVITIAQEGEVPGNVVAFDIFPRQFHSQTDKQERRLPEGSAFFLCDSSGTLLYSETRADIPREQIQSYINTIIDRIKDGTFDSNSAYIHTPGQEKRAAYFDITTNGWLSIVTIPYSSLLGGVRTISIWFVAILLVFLAVFVIMSVREERMNRTWRRTNETVRVLGNSFYAIYRMDFSRGTYDMIKGSDYVRRKIPPQGDYDLLMNTMGELMKPDVFEDFRTSFSLENIRSLVSRRVRDYGGDFQRVFDGEYRWVNVRLLFDESLNPEEAVLCFRMVDDEKKEQLSQIELLKESLKAARESEESKNSFFSNMSHDMRTPLNAIIGLSELAEKHLDDREKMKDYMSKINFSSQQLLGLINDILEISKLEKGKITLDTKHFDLKKCITDCADMVRDQIKREGKTFTLDFDIKTREVYGDSFRVTQILSNLLSNAVKFTSEGDAISLKVSERQNSDFVKYKLVLKDTGAGMSRDFLDRIFIPYEREVRFGAKNVSGTGLGMPIVKNILSQMNGEISVESELGKGSTFTVILPFRKADVEEEMEENPVSGETSGNEVDITGSGGEKKADQAESGKSEEDFLRNRKILLAEDNEINMEIACELLDMYGAQVVKAWNGKEAVDLFAASGEDEFDVILMDMQMPEMDGCEAARTIRKMKRRDAEKIPIIAVTANAFAEDLSATAAAGMNAHISKPIDFSLLCRTLKEVIDQQGNA